LFAEIHDLPPTLVERIALDAERNELIVRLYLHGAAKWGCTLIFAASLAQAQELRFASSPPISSWKTTTLASATPPTTGPRMTLPTICWRSTGLRVAAMAEFISRWSENEPLHHDRVALRASRMVAARRLGGSRGRLV